MKVLKYILYAIIALVLLFVLIGLIVPEVSYGHKISVDKSIKDFIWFLDFLFPEMDKMYYCGNNNKNSKEDQDQLMVDMIVNH